MNGPFRKYPNLQLPRQGWLSRRWTDINDRYLTSAFSCVISCITRVLAPRSETILYVVSWQNIDIKKS